MTGAGVVIDSAAPSMNIGYKTILLKQEPVACEK